MALGNILRAAREQQGLTPSQVAEATHMMVQVVEELEREDFRRFAAAIYGRGFVKIYAEHLGIDPAPLVQEFNELYSGARRPQIRTRPVASPPAASPPAAGGASPAEAPSAAGGDEEEAADILAPGSPLPPAAPPLAPPPAEQHPDLFSTLANHAFGGRPLELPALRQAAARQPDGGERPLSPGLASAVLEQRPALSPPSFKERLAGFARRLAGGLKAAARPPRRLTLAAVGVLAALAVLLVVARLGGQARRRAAGAPAAGAGAGREHPALTGHLLPPPEAYVD
jgi:transcriptional regulator with XRE-family HTH domain